MFSKLDDPNRVIPQQRGRIFAYSSQIIVALVFLLFIFAPLLPGNLSDLFYRYLDYIYIPFLIVVLGGAIASGIYINWNLKRRWEMLASTLNLQVEQGNWLSHPTLTGTFRGHQVSVEITAVKRGRSRTYYTNFFITFNEPGENTLTAKRRARISLNRETIGDEEIDKKLSIETSSEPMLRRILANNRLRQGLLELGEPNRLKELSISKKNIHYIERERITDTDYIHAVLRYLTDLANMVERFDRMAF